MKDIGINKIYYSTGKNNEIICESIKNMVSIQSASIHRYLESFNNEKYDMNYFECLFIKIFPKTIKETNLFYFLEYNFKNVLPQHSYIIHKNYITFYNINNKELLRSNII